MLRADHSLVEDLFAQFEKARTDERKVTVAVRVCMELRIHTSIEEEIFYPAAREELTRNEDLLDEAKVEHDSAKQLIQQIEAGKPGEERWDAKVSVLAEYVKHHVKEEQNELFPKVRKTRLDSKALGEQLRQRKEQLMERMGS